jgi:hypothetical protein
MLSAGLPLSQKADELAAVDEKGFAIVNRLQAGLDPLPYGLGMKGEKLGDLVD